jgi:3-isopropylmalate dehydratase small subunit
LPEKEISAGRVDTAEIILTGKTYAVRGALSSEAIIVGEGHGMLGTAGELLLATGPMGEGEMAAQAVAALQRSGTIGVIAPAFAWPFFRLCVNLGLPPLTLWEAAEIRTGDRLRADLTGQVVKNLSSGTRYPIRNLSDLYVAILACGGMTGYIRALRAER